MKDEYPIVVITWRDACGGDGWVSMKELQDETLVEHNSVGFLVNETPEFMTMTMSYEEEEKNLGAYLVIPKVNISNVRYIKNDTGTSGPEDNQ
jgi:hypothetical protein